MTELKLRNYQAEAIDAAFAAWSEGMKRPAIVLPTGAGKTVVFAHLIKDFRMRAPYRAHSMGAERGAPGTRVMVLVHRDELADQAINKIRSIAPDLDVGKVKAGDNEIGADVMVCSVQTLAVKHRLDALVGDQYSVYGPVGLIITDECHHGSAPSYQKIYDAFPEALNLGVTATMARGDGNGLGDVWDDVVYRKSVLWMISKGHLVDVKARTIDMDFQMGGIKKSRGDYQAGDLGRAMEDQHADEAIAKAYVEHAKDRPGVVFTPTVDTAELAAKSLNLAGIETAVITGETPREERQQIFRDFREGTVQVLANCMVLTEGFDAPWASCAVIARPTQSEPLYQQMVGRVLRTWPGKKDALVLHLAGSGGTLRTLVDLDSTIHVEKVLDDETLAEAVEREAEAAGVAAPPGSVAFDLKMREHDLFKGSLYAWSKTNKGVLFIECGETTVFLWPEKAGTYSVCQKTRNGKWHRSSYQNLDLSTAMAWGEAIAEDYASFSVTRSASWRKAKPSDAQLNLAERLGIQGAETMRKGDLSQAIGQFYASREFDPYVGTLYL